MYVIMMFTFVFCFFWERLLGDMGIVVWVWERVCDEYMRYDWV